jgi:hypothetical protein
MKDGKVEKKLMSLSTKIISWDRQNASDILDYLNDFENTINNTTYDTDDFGINPNTIPSYKIKNEYIESGVCIAKDKNKMFIVGIEPPYKILNEKQLKEFIEDLHE